MPNNANSISTGSGMQQHNSLGGGMMVGVNMTGMANHLPVQNSHMMHNNSQSSSPTTVQATNSSPITTNNSINSTSSVNSSNCNGTENNNSNINNVANTKEKTSMCLINELARHNKIQHQYRLTNEIGPGHKKTFTVRLRLGEEEYEASGPSIKKAQHAAASFALQKTSYKHPPPKPNRLQIKTSNDITPTVELNALAMKRGEPTEYKQIPPPPKPQYYPNFNYRGIYQQRYHYPRLMPLCYVSLRVGSNEEFLGEGQTLQAARHNAAAKALKMLRDLPLPESANKPVESTDNALQLSPTPKVNDCTPPPPPPPPPLPPPTTKAVISPPTSAEPPNNTIDVNSDLKSPISLVHELALKKNLQVDFEVVDESGPPHMRTFITKCIVGDVVTEGEGNGKKVSKKRAAEKMLEELRKTPVTLSVQRVKKKPNTVRKKSHNLIKELKGSPEYGHGINPISRLIQIQQAKKEKEPVYTLLTERGVPRRREFVIQVSVGQHCYTGNGPNKKVAKRNAAEGILQMLGYSRPSPQSPKPACLKPLGPEIESDKNRKVTFLDQEGGTSNSKGDCETRCGRQLVPGLLLMSDPGLTNDGSHNIQSYLLPSSGSTNDGIHRSLMGHLQNQDIMAKIPIHTPATIAKELLEYGTSKTAEALLSSSKKQFPAQPLSKPKQQLELLAEVLGLSIMFSDFPRGNKREFLSLVTLNTTPPQVSHGAGETLEESHDQAALTALRALAESSLDSLTKIKKEPIVVAGNESVHSGGAGHSSVSSSVKMNSTGSGLVSCSGPNTVKTSSRENLN